MRLPEINLQELEKIKKENFRERLEFQIESRRGEHISNDDARDEGLGCVAIVPTKHPYAFHTPTVVDRRDFYGGIAVDCINGDVSDWPMDHAGDPSADGGPARRLDSDDAGASVDEP